jgi:lactate dehydrogenase-like 2-hydroxyacid dehydrogenase
MKPDLVSAGTGMLLDPHHPELARDFTVHYLPAKADEHAAFLRPIADKVRFLQTTGAFGASAAFMDLLPKLEIIASVSVGMDTIDLAHAKKRGIRVTNTPDVLNDCVADLAIGLMIAAARRLAASDRYVRDGKWLKGNMPITSRVSRKRLGIVGLGKIGKVIAKRATGFDMAIAYHGRAEQKDVPYRFYADLAEMAANVDFMVIVTPGGAATKGLVSDKVIRALGPKGILVNVARGSVVDEPALVRALEEGALGGAGLDVFAAEPKVPEELFALDTVALTPHVGSATTETRLDMGSLAIANLRAHLAGKPLLTPVV